MPGGQQINTGQGFISAIAQELLGEEITCEEGDLAGRNTILLRSRKIGAGSSASAPLVGVASTLAQGAFAKTRTRPLAGIATTVSAGTVVTLNSEPTWNQVPSVIQFTFGFSGTYNLTQHTSNFDAARHFFRVWGSGSALPTGVTLSQAGILSYDGVGAVTTVSNVSFEIADKAPVLTGIVVTVSRGTMSPSGGASDDWTVRRDFALATGGTAVRFDTQAEVLNDVFLNSNSVHVTWDQSLKRSGNGSMRIAVPTTLGEGDPAWRGWMRANHAIVGNGGEYYVQWSQYMPASFLTAFPGNNGGFANGFKQIICSWGGDDQVSGGSFTNNEIVVENSQQMGCPRAYHLTSTGSFTNFDQLQSWGSETDFRFQPSIDNGGAIPGTGQFTQAWLKWGPMNSMPKNTGTPHPSNGGFVYVADTWMTFMLRVKFGTLGTSTGHTFEMWCAVSGQAPRKILSFVNNFNLGAENGGHRRFWLTPYNTLRTGGGGINSFTNYDEVLTSIGANPIPFPGGFNVTPA